MVAAMHPRLLSLAEWRDFTVPDGYRAEIIQHELVVTPAPAFRHVEVQNALADLLRPQLPAELKALIGAEWILAERGFVAAAPQPDLVVVRRGITGLDEAPPLLAVEVVSPSDHRRLENGVTRLQGKRLDYAAHGLTDYLEVDLTVEPITIVRYELRDGALAEVDRVAGSEALVAERPFAYELTPVTLTAP